MSTFSAVERLQALSLISKVCEALDEHLGMSDKTLAEFIIDLAGKRKEELTDAHGIYLYLLISTHPYLPIIVIITSLSFIISSICPYSTYNIH
jgi:hypothetical protein